MDNPGQKVVNKYDSYGFIGGIALGLIAGILISGPNFNVWPPLTSILVTLGGGVVGGVIGLFASAIALGAQASGPDICEKESTTERDTGDESNNNS